MTDDGLIQVGVITGVRGLQGEVRVKSFTQDPEALGAYGGLVTEAGEAIDLTVTGRAKGVVTARIKGVADCDAAEALKGTELFVSRATLPQTDPDEFYYSDLIGLVADLKDGGTLGNIKAVHDYGAGVSLEVESEKHGPVMVPFTRDAVPEVDIEGGRVVIDPPPGLLEPGKPEPAQEARTGDSPDRED